MTLTSDLIPDTETASLLTVGSHWIGYHANCPDGFTAAYMLATALEELGAEPPALCPLTHGQEMPHPFQEHVWLLDFANVPIEWLEMHASAGMHLSFVILDHHQTAQGLLEAYTTRCEERAYSTDADWMHVATEWSSPLVETSHIMVIDQTKSGAGLVAEYLAALGIGASNIFWPWPYVQDRDLWQWKLDGTKYISSAISSRPYTPAAWEDINNTGFEALRTEGFAVERYRQQLIDSCLLARFEITLPGLDYAILATNAPYSIGSDVAGQLATFSPSGIGAYIIVHGEDLQVGLRSAPDGPDVAAIAEPFGGGGHRGAAGLRLPLSFLSDTP